MRLSADYLAYFTVGINTCLKLRKITKTLKKLKYYSKLYNVKALVYYHLISKSN